MSKRTEYSIIAIAGRMNAGKSTLLNLLSGQKDFAIVDARPGTTADTVAARMEIHGLGPVKILDTAGLDETSELGEKKRRKTWQAVAEADLTLIVIDLMSASKLENFSIEKEIADQAKQYHKQALIIYNIRRHQTCCPDSPRQTLAKQQIRNSQSALDKKLNLRLPSLCLNAQDLREQKKLLDFIKASFSKPEPRTELLPIKVGKGYALLIIPMDEETPAMRLLRPQDMAVERLLRKNLIPVLYRPDLKKARDGEKEEKQKFLQTVNLLKDSPLGLKLVITDSQAMDIMQAWMPRQIPLTTFSVMMANYMSYGRLDLFLQGLQSLRTLKSGDNIMIMESCNHDRKCNDIGTKQIPNLLKEKLGLNLNLDFSFGRPLPDNLKQYKLIIHCGGCMIDRQKYNLRISKIKEAGVPMTNYGLFFSWIHNPAAAQRVCKIFNK